MTVVYLEVYTPPSMSYNGLVSHCRIQHRVKCTLLIVHYRIQQSEVYTISNIILEVQAWILITMEFLYYPHYSCCVRSTLDILICYTAETTTSYVCICFDWHCPQCPSYVTDVSEYFLIIYLIGVSVSWFLLALLFTKLDDR